MQPNRNDTRTLETLVQRTPIIVNSRTFLQVCAPPEGLRLPQIFSKGRLATGTSSSSAAAAAP